MRQIKVIIALICAVGTMSAQADEIVWDISGVVVDGSGAGSYSANLAAGAGEVTGIAFDFGWQTFGISWTEELVLQIVAPTGDTFCAATAGATFGTGDYCFDLFGTALDFDFGGNDFGGQILFSGGSALLNGLASAGDWTLNLLDGFDDFGNDGFVFNEGWVSLSYTPVPEPGTLALLGIGLLGMGAARHRRKV